MRPRAPATAPPGSSRTNVEREWHRPNTPLPQTVWSIRNNVNLQQSALLIALNYMAENKEDFLKNFYLKGQRSIAKATTEGPAAYVFPADDARPALQARLLQLMQEQAVEVHRLTRDATVGDKEYGAGSYVIRMDQPYSRMADMLLDTQYYNPADPSPYDDVGWTLGPLFNVTTDRIEDHGHSRSPHGDGVVGGWWPPGEVAGARGAGAFIIDYAGEANLTSFRFAHPDLSDQRRGGSLRGGRQVLPALDPSSSRSSGNPENLVKRPGQPQPVSSASWPGAWTKCPTWPCHPVGAPRVAVMHTWSTHPAGGVAPGRAGRIQDPLRLRLGARGPGQSRI